MLVSETLSRSPQNKRPRNFPPTSDDARFFDRVRFVLEKPSHPGNIGATARAMATMGFSRLYLVAPQKFPAKEAISLASGATPILDKAVVTQTLAEALVGVTYSAGFSARPRELVGDTLPLDAFATECVARALADTHAANAISVSDELRPMPEIALVFGTEMTGLSNEALSVCSVAVTIPANPAYSSLNLSQAVQVAAYALRIAAGKNAVWQAPRFTPATFEEIEGLKAHAKATLTRSGFLNPENPKRLMPRLARLFARAELERDEVNILRGILATLDHWLEAKK